MSSLESGGANGSSNSSNENGRDPVSSTESSVVMNGGEGSTRGESCPGEEHGQEQHEQEQHERGDTSPSFFEERMGTVSSARFNLLATMVSGGSLSLPLAFQKSGNGLIAPLILLFVASATEYCLRVLASSGRAVSPVSPSTANKGSDSFESISSAAFGPKAHVFSKGLVTVMCFFAAVAYAVLLRDMLEPVSDMIFPPSREDGDGSGSPSRSNNITMLAVILLVTPLCLLRNLTSLERYQATSMFAVLILGGCILYRSLQCNTGHMSSSSSSAYDFLYEDGSDSGAWKQSFQLLPDNWKDVLDTFPIFVSCYVCHYNVPLVHNELQQPSQKRVSWWLRSTVWSATVFYMLIGLSGSAFATCSPSGTVLHGNILLDFDEDDPLVFVGRMCLALTITIAFPMLIIPARDIVIRSLGYGSPGGGANSPADADDANEQVRSGPTTSSTPPADDNQASLQEPLLQNEHDPEQAVNATTGNGQSTPEEQRQQQPSKEESFAMRLAVTLLLFWSAAAIASCVTSVDIVWDLMGSGLSMMMSYLIPCGCYIVIVGKRQRATTSAIEDGTWRSKNNVSIVVAWLFVLLFTPLMFLLTANAVYNTFFDSNRHD